MAPKKNLSQPKPTPRKKKTRKPKVVDAKYSTAAKSLTARYSSAARDEKILAMVMGLPRQTGAVRFPTKDAPRTSVMCALDQRTFTASNSYPINWSYGDMLIAFYGQPARLAMVYAVLPNPSYYQLNFVQPGGGTGTTWTIYPSPLLGSIDQKNGWELTSITPTAAGGGALVHGRTMSFGMSGSGHFVFLNANDFVEITSCTAGVSTLAGSVLFNVILWTGRDTTTEYTIVSRPLVGGVLANAPLFTASQAGYYKIESAGFSITSGTSGGAFVLGLRLNLAATVGWTQVSMGDLDVQAGGDLVIGQEVRVNAAALLVTNTTSVLNRQGTVLAARIRSTDFLAVSPASLARLSEKYTGDAAKGVYTFKEFSDYAERFQNVVLSDVSQGVWFDLDMDDYYHFIQITCPNVGTSANTFTFSFDTVLEFKTDSARYAKGVSDMDEHALVLARRLVNSRPEWFYENPLHVADIYNFIKRAVSGAARASQMVAPYAAKALSFYHPEGAPAFEALANLMRNVNLS